MLAPAGSRSQVRAFVESGLYHPAMAERLISTETSQHCQGVLACIATCPIRVLTVMSLLVTLDLVLAPGASATDSAHGVVAWGNNEDGQLGNGTTTNSTAPVPVSGLRNVRALSAGGMVYSGAFGLALLRSSTVMAWGSNDVGQLGDGTTTNRTEPVSVSGLSDIKGVSAGGVFCLALRRSGGVLAWGDNEEGELGNGTTTSSDVPVVVKDLNNAKAVSAGLTSNGTPTTGSFGLALREDGTVMAWGDNEEGQLGNGGIAPSNMPNRVDGLSHVKAISAGDTFALALLNNGTVMAWGDNEFGELGNGTMTESNVPVLVSGLSDVRAIAAGGGFSLALLADGTVMAWGDNEFGELGNGTTIASDIPIAVTNLSDVKSISAGTIHSVARLDNGSVMTWGESWGNGLNVNTYNEVPVAVAGLTHIRHIAAGLDFSLAS
jgi:alpha-tubulin suppressor-like RCC1 family protein